MPHTDLLQNMTSYYFSNTLSIYLFLVFLSFDPGRFFVLRFSQEYCVHVFVQSPKGVCERGLIGDKCVYECLFRFFAS